MSKRSKKRGLPTKLEQDDSGVGEREQSPKEFVQEFFGDGAAESQDGLPTMQWLKENFTTKSAAIRYLISQGHDVKTISKHLGLRYQHVRNVATSPLKRGPNEPWLPKSERPDSQNPNTWMPPKVEAPKLSTQDSSDALLPPEVQDTDNDDEEDEDDAGEDTDEDDSRLAAPTVDRKALRNC